VTERPLQRAEHVPLALVADDDDAARKLLSAWLEALGCRVLSSRDGVELVEQLEALDVGGQLQDPFLVVTDLDMPRCNGLAALDLIRQRYALARVVVVTAFGDARMRARAHTLGAEAVLDKPFRLRDIGELASRYLAVQSPSPGPWPPAVANDGAPTTPRSGH
jgi:CheY-like chemotaxis protein